MDELHIDLDKPKKSTYKKILGLSSVILSIIWFIGHHHIYLFDYLYGLYFLLMGIGYYLDGSRFILHLFGNPHIDLTNNYFRIKPTTFSRENILKWNDVESLKIRLVSVEITTLGKETLKIDLLKFDYPVVLELKEALTSISKELNLALE